MNITPQHQGSCRCSAGSHQDQRICQTCQNKTSPVFAKPAKLKYHFKVVPLFYKNTFTRTYRDLKFSTTICMIWAVPIIYTWFWSRCFMFYQPYVLIAQQCSQRYTGAKRVRSLVCSTISTSKNGKASPRNICFHESCDFSFWARVLQRRAGI